MGLFNQKRKKSAYLNHNKNGKVVSDIPNDKLQKNVKKAKSGILNNIKKIILFIIFCIITFIFLLQVRYMLGYINTEMAKEDTKYTTTSEKVDEGLKSININTQKELELKRKTITLNVDSFNQYDKEISSIFFSLKGSITQYYNGKEGVYATQTSYDGILGRIKLDKDIITTNENLTGLPIVRDHYIKRLENIEKFIKDNYDTYNKDTLVNNVNNCIDRENSLKINGRKEIEKYLKTNDIDYTITDEKISVKIIDKK